MLVREVMTTSPVTVRPGTTLQAAMRLVAEAHVTSLPVVNAAGQLRGIVSEADLIKDRVPADPRLHELAHPGDLPDRHDFVEQEDPDRCRRIGHDVTVPSHVAPRASPSVLRVKDLRPCC